MKKEFKKEVYALFMKHAKFNCERGITLDISDFINKLYEKYIEKK